MVEKRSQKRRNTLFYLNTKDSLTDKPVGRLVDITLDGFMLVSKHPLPVNREFNLTLELPETLENNQSISFRAVSLHSKKDINPDLFDTGFRFLNISQKSSRVITLLMNNYMFNG